MEERSRFLSVIRIDKRTELTIFHVEEEKRKHFLWKEKKTIGHSSSRKKKILMDDSVRIKTRVKRVSVERVSQTRIQLSIYESPLHVQSHGGS